MELLKELFNIHQDALFLDGINVQLFEDLGQLKKIDKDLFKIFVKPKDRWGDKEKGQKVRGSLGQNSKVEEYTEANQNTAWTRFHDDKIAKALILQYDGEQIFATIKVTAGGYRDKPQFAFVLKPSFFDKIIYKDAYNKAMGGIKTKTSRNYRGTVNTYDEKTEFEAGRASEGTTTDTISKIKTVMKLVFDAAKKNKVDLKTVIVTIDEKRMAKSHERIKVRSGMIPLPTSDKVAIGGGKMSTYEKEAERYFKDLRSDLRSRLETYKASKAKTFSTQEDLLNSLIKEGYFEKLKFMGFTYKFYNDRINFGELKKGETRQGYESYIEYKIQEGTPEYKNASADVDKLRGELGEKRIKAGSEEEKEALQDAYYAERKKILPPAEFKVILKLEGGVITPSKIQIGKDEAYLY